MGSIRVDPEQLISVGAAIEAEAEGLGALGASLGVGAMAVEDPPATADALAQVGNQWRPGIDRLREDLLSLGRGVQAASTLYVETDRAAMGPP